GATTPTRVPASERSHLLLGAERRRADEPGVRPEVGGDDAGRGAVAASGQLPGEGVPGRTEEEVPGRADAAADDEDLGIECRGEVGDPDPEPVPDLGEQLDGRRVAGPG